MKKFIEDKLNEGFTLNRLAKLLEVSYPALKAHYEGEAKSVNLKLAKSVYKNFGVVIEPYLEVEVK